MLTQTLGTKRTSTRQVVDVEASDAQPGSCIPEGLLNGRPNTWLLTETDPHILSPGLSQHGTGLELSRPTLLGNAVFWPQRPILSSGMWGWRLRVLGKTTEILGPPKCQLEGAHLWFSEGPWSGWLRAGFGLLLPSPPKALLGSLGSEATAESNRWASTTSPLSLLQKGSSEGLELWA